jgi:hypothetical protein
MLLSDAELVVLPLDETGISEAGSYPGLGLLDVGYGDELEQVHVPLPRARRLGVRAAPALRQVRYQKHARDQGDEHDAQRKTLESQPHDRRAETAGS